MNNTQSILKRKFALTFAVILLILIIFAGMFLFTNLQQYSVRNVESITIGMDQNQVNLLVYVAENRGYFVDNDLNVKVMNYSSGLAAFRGLMRGEVDIAAATEFIFVRNVFTNQSIQTIGSIDKFQQIYIVARKDRGIGEIKDLEGKNIGLTIHTASEFCLSRFLELQGMSINQLNLVDISPSRIPEAIINGTVDAIVGWEPHVGAIEDTLGSRVVVWSAQSGQSAYNLIVTTSNLLSNPRIAEHFLNSLNHAEDYVTNYPSETKIILQNRLNFSSSFVEKIWPLHRFSLSLDQSLVAAMQDQSRWIVSNDLTKSKTTPNFLNFVYVNALEKVKPGSVNIIR
jgi:ABC-type nitrate/sulfonate/bicarbonate transport system substrate-binding protein